MKTILNEEIENAYGLFMKDVMEAIEEAIQNNIETNTIILNDKFDMCKELYYSLMPAGQIYEVPPMVLGKYLVLAPLPDKYKFSVTHLKKFENNVSFADILKILRKYVRIKNGCPVFANLSFKKNTNDYELLKSIIGHEDIAECVDHD